MIIEKLRYFDVCISTKLSDSINRKEQNNGSFKLKLRYIVKSKFDIRTKLIKMRLT